eukprot:13563589-Heterocapsa_arctica.AAC.1
MSGALRPVVTEVAAAIWRSTVMASGDQAPLVSTTMGRKVILTARQAASVRSLLFMGRVAASAAGLDQHKAG